jgi:uncharacterized protein (DUF433 family)
MSVTMATAAKKATYPHIESTPDVRGGKPCIDGTRIAVVDIAIAHTQGIKPEEMLTYFSSRPLTLAEVHAALTYHYDHPEELEDYLRRSEKAIGELEAARAEYLRRKTRP